MLRKETRPRSSGRAVQLRITYAEVIPWTSQADDVEISLEAHLKGGGHLVITPESLLADQYLRPLDFFAQIGVELVKSTAGGIELAEAHHEARP
jgi:hypothetical protein